MSLIRQAAATFILFFLSICVPARVLAICTEYQHYPDVEIEKYINILQDPEKSEIKRSNAYEKIACSDNPIYRQHALTIGLRDTSASILRSQILMDAMMSKDIFVIDLIESPNLSKGSKAYIKENNSQIRFKAYKRDPSEGCITINSHSECGSGRQVSQVKITGKYVEVTFSNLYGKFELTSSNQLEGYVISSNGPKTEKILAKLSLF